MLFFRQPSASGIASPWGTYEIRPTSDGIEFKVSVRDPRNKLLLGVLIASSTALAVLICPGFWSFLVLLPQLLLLDAALYVCLAATKLSLVEIRPDGLKITPDINDERSALFFHRESIISRQLDFDEGLSFRYGIYDIRATPGFANLREFECFEQQLEAVIARLWHQSNLQ